MQVLQSISMLGMMFFRDSNFLCKFFLCKFAVKILCKFAVIKNLKMQVDFNSALLIMEV